MAISKWIVDQAAKDSTDIGKLLAIIKDKVRK